MLLVGYCYGIRSERRLCEDVEDRLTFRWFCRLDLDDRVPDHSTFSKNRHGRFRDSDVLRHVFERVVLACITAGLVGGEGFAVDASLIEADANKGRSIPGAEWSKERDPATASHAVKEYLATLDDDRISGGAPFPEVHAPRTEASTAQLSASDAVDGSSHGARRAWGWQNRSGSAAPVEAGANFMRKSRAIEVNF